jgi:HD-GYP domain-containing protein (c-di-GMP phosphodiesterase class II)
VVWTTLVDDQRGRSQASMDQPVRDRLNPIMPVILAAAAVAAFALLLVVGAAAAAAAAVAIVLLVAATGLAAVGWRAARNRERHLRAVADALRDERSEERKRLERHARRLEDALSHERILLRRLRDSWQAEREWSRELRRQLQELHGRSSERGNVLELVLKAAIQLVNAEKGLLLTREDEDDDGDLDLVTALGFQNDPEHSSVAQRFARDVLAEDQIIREDRPAKPREDATAADEEIEGLVAIPLYLRDRFHGVIVCANRPGGFAEVDDDVLLALGNQAGAMLHHGRVNQDLREAHRAVVRVLAEAVAARDPVLHRESLALSVLAGRLAADLGLDEHDRDVLVTATLLRSVGYLPLPERLFLSPGPLTPDERSLVSLHPRLGFEILRQAPALREPATAVLYHHERYDGQGYPAGLEAQDIPLTARALSVLEAYSAMTHERPHRSPCSSDEACDELIDHAGTQFDPEIVQLLVERMRQRPAVPGGESTDGLLESLPLDRPESDDRVIEGVRASTLDGLTLLGDHHALLRDVQAAANEATAARRFAIVLLQLHDLPRINDELGYLAGDRVIEVAARRAATAATRLGATAYRASGRRLAMQVPLREGDDLGEVLEDIRTQFVGGPAVEVVASAWKPGERGEAVIMRARRALKRGPST